MTPLYVSSNDEDNRKLRDDYIYNGFAWKQLSLLAVNFQRYELQLNFYGQRQIIHDY